MFDEIGPDQLKCSDISTELPQKSIHAQSLLNLLGRERFEFRCFSDQPDRSLRDIPQRLVGTLEEHKNKLRLLNDSGYGIFVQVNDNDGRGNTASNITQAPTFFVDLDGTPLETIDRLRLTPHMVVSSSKGKFHTYWCVRDVPLAEYKAIQQRLAKLVNSDPAVCDLPRVMRLPGFLHMKDRDNPYLVHPIQISDEPPFLFEQFSAALSAAEAAHPSLDATTSDHPFKGDDPHKGDLARDEVLIRYLVKNAQLDLSIYSEWIKLGIALKNTHKDAGFELWHNLSQEFGGYESWDDCSRSWKSIIPSSNPEDRLTMGSYAKRARDAGWRITFAFVPAPHLACAIAH